MNVPPHDGWALVGLVAASAFALARLSLGHHNRMAERLSGVLESSLGRQAEAWAVLAAAVQGLEAGLRDQAALLRRLLEREADPPGGTGCR